MRHAATRGFAALILSLLALSALAGTAIPLAAATPPGPGEIAIKVTGLRSAKGVVRACLTSQPANFPRSCDDPSSLRAVAQAGEQVEFTFASVQSGRYAVALLHDENGNGKADRALGMMPREGFGFSRDAPVRLGPPNFDSAAFDFNGKAQALTIRMRYML